MATAKTLDTSLVVVDKIFNNSFRYNDTGQTVYYYQEAIKNEAIGPIWAVNAQRVAWQSMFLTQLLEKIFNEYQNTTSSISSTGFKSYVSKNPKYIKVATEAGKAIDALSKTGLSKAAPANTRNERLEEAKVIPRDPGTALLLQALVLASQSTAIKLYFQNGHRVWKEKTDWVGQRLVSYFGISSDNSEWSYFSALGLELNLGDDARGAYSSPPRNNFMRNTYLNGGKQIVPQARHNTPLCWIAALASYKVFIKGVSVNSSDPNVKLAKDVSNSFSKYISDDGSLTIGANKAYARGANAKYPSTSFRSTLTSSGYDGYVLAALKWIDLTINQRDLFSSNLPSGDIQTSISKVSNYWRDRLRNNGYAEMGGEPTTNKGFKGFGPNDALTMSTNPVWTMKASDGSLVRKGLSPNHIISTGSVNNKGGKLTSSQINTFKSWVDTVDRKNGVILNEITKEYFSLASSRVNSWKDVTLGGNLERVFDLMGQEHVENGTVYLYTLFGAQQNFNSLRLLEEKLKDLESYSVNTFLGVRGGGTRNASYKNRSYPFILDASTSNLAASSRALSGLYFILLADMNELPTT